jgi:hypothetical protein
VPVRRRVLQFVLAGLVVCLLAAAGSVGYLASRPGDGDADASPVPTSQAGLPELIGVPRPGTLPQGYAGVWKGTAASPVANFAIELTLRPGQVGTDVGSSANTGAAASSRCERTEQLAAAALSGVTLLATLTKGDGCDDNGVTELVLRPDGTLSYATTWLSGKMSGVLHRAG